MKNDLWRRRLTIRCTLLVPWLQPVVTSVTLASPWSSTSLPILTFDPWCQMILSTQLTGCFLFWEPFSVNPGDGCGWKSQWMSSLSRARLAPNHRAAFKSHWNPPFLPHSDAKLWSSASRLHHVYCSSRCHLTGRLAICANQQLNVLPNKVAIECKLHEESFHTI